MRSVGCIVDVVFPFPNQLQDKATVLTTERKKVTVRQFLKKLNGSRLVQIADRYVIRRQGLKMYFNVSLEFRGERLCQKSSSEPRISASIAKWPPML